MWQETENGYIYKDESAFKPGCGRVCYIPENAETLHKCEIPMFRLERKGWDFSDRYNEAAKKLQISPETAERFVKNRYGRVKVQVSLEDEKFDVKYRLVSSSEHQEWHKVKDTVKAMRDLWELKVNGNWFYYEDFFRIARMFNGDTVSGVTDEALARAIFDGVTWEFPSSWLSEMPLPEWGAFFVWEDVTASDRAFLSQIEPIYEGKYIGYDVSDINNLEDVSDALHEVIRQSDAERIEIPNLSHSSLVWGITERDVQEKATEELGRELTPAELEVVGDKFGEVCDWNDTLDAILGDL